MSKDNKIRGIKVGTILADIRGGICSETIGDKSSKLFKFGYSPYKIIGFDLDEYGEVSKILCNMGRDDRKVEKRVWDENVRCFPASDYGEYLFIEGSLGLYNKARDMYNKFFKEDPICCNDFKENTSYTGKIESPDGHILYRDVYILKVLRQYFDDVDYVLFTMCSYGVSSFYEEKVFKGPFLLTMDCFIEDIIGGFLRDKDWVPGKGKGQDYDQ